MTAPLKSHPFRPIQPTPEQQRALEIARVGMMNHMPFLAHMYYSTCREVITLDMPTAATDGRHIIVNPEYLCSLKDHEKITVLCHEMWHAVAQHPQRFRGYTRTGDIKGHPVDHEHANKAMDWVINADLFKSGLALNPSWLYRTDVKGDEFWEDVYARTFPNCPPQPRGNSPQQPQDGQGKGQDASQGGLQKPQPGQKPPTPTTGDGTLAGSGQAHRGGKRDPYADANGGSFDEILPVPIDPLSGQDDLPDEAEFREAVAQAVAAAKAMGKTPGGLQRFVDEILAPQISWREHIRLLMTGKLGSHGEDWARPNRRRLALNPIVIMPGRRGWGCDTVAVGVDTSGSIGKRELAAFLAEVGGVLADCKPRRIIVLGCDAAVHAVEEVRTLDELGSLARKGLGGGGGTSFVPVFEYIAENNVKPEALVYLTDMCGQFPHAAPAYPVIWAATTDVGAPFGDVVRIKL